MARVNLKKARTPFKKSRAQASTPEVISMFFDGLEVCFKEHGFFRRSYGDLASQIFNCDEVGFATAVASSKVLAKKGSRNVYDVQNGCGQENITFLVGGSAAGTT